MRKGGLKGVAFFVMQFSFRCHHVSLLFATKPFAEGCGLSDRGHSSVT